MESLLLSTGVVALAEIGDKTQIATIAMAAHYAAPLLVVIGTTLGVATLLGAGSSLGF